MKTKPKILPVTRSEVRAYLRHGKDCPLATTVFTDTRLRNRAGLLNAGIARIKTDMKLIAALCMLCLAVQAQQSESPKIAFAFNGGPCLADGDPINSYCAIVVTGAVALASAPVVVEWCGGLDGKWSAMATNHLTAGSGKFWLRTNVDLAWTIFYDYDWRKTPAKFYRIKTIKP